MANGLSEAQMVERMYTAMLGLDGQSGMVKDIADGKKSRKVIYDKIEIIESTSVTKKECQAVRNNITTQKRNKWLIIKDILLIIVGPAGGASAILLFLKFWGK